MTPRVPSSADFLVYYQYIRPRMPGKGSGSPLSLASLCSLFIGVLRILMLKGINSLLKIKYLKKYWLIRAMPALLVIMYTGIQTSVAKQNPLVLFIYLIVC